MDRLMLLIHRFSSWGGIFLCITGLFLYAKKRKMSSATADNKLKGVFNDRINRYAAWVLFIVALLLRFYQLDICPQGINQDEAMAVLNARSILETGKDLSGNTFPAEFVAWGNGGQSVLLAYSMLPFIKIFGDGLNIIRLVPVIYSILGLISFYYLAKCFLSDGKALVVTTFATFSPWHFMQSRWGLDCNLMSHLWILGILLLIKGMSDKRLYYISAAIFGLSMYSYGISFYTITFYLISGASYLLYKHLITFKQIFGCILIYLTISLPIDMTMFVNAFHLDTITIGGITMPLLADQIRSNDILLLNYSFDQLLTNARFLGNILISQFDGLWFNSNFFFGSIFMCSMPFALVGCVKVVYMAHTSADTKERAIYMLLWLYVLISLLSGLITKEVNVSRINFVFYGLMLLVGIGISTLDGSFSLWKKAVYAMYLINIIGFMLMYFTLWAQTSGFFPDYEMAIARAAGIDKDKCAVVVEYNSPDIARILTMYEQKVPAIEYQDGTFDERYTFYESVNELDFSKKDDTVYVVRKDDEGFFSDLGFSYSEEYLGYLVFYD